MSISCKCPACGKQLKAPDSAAGKKAKCPKCGNPLRIPGEKVYDAEEVYEADEVVDEGASDDEFGLQGLDLSASSAGPAEDRRRACPMCGEMIVASAAKCRYCGEVFDATLKRQKKKKKNVSDEDEYLTAADWVLGLVCANIGCILSIIYMIQGKPKGVKMFGVACLGQFIGVVLYIIVNVLASQ